MSLGDGLIGSEAVKQSRFVHAVDASKQDTFQVLPDGVTLRGYLPRVNGAALAVGGKLVEAVKSLERLKPPVENDGIWSSGRPLNMADRTAIALIISSISITLGLILQHPVCKGLVYYRERKGSGPLFLEVDVL